MAGVSGEQERGRGQAGDVVAGASRGQEDPPPSPRAVRTAPLGYELAAVLEGELVVPLLERIAQLSGRLS